MVAVKVELVDENERGCGAVYLADRDGAVEGDDGGGGKLEQVVVEGDNLRPVGLVEGCCVGVHGADRGLELVGAGLVSAQTAADDRLAFFDPSPVPACAILVAEQHERAVGSRARRASGFGQEQQGEQAGNLRLVGHQR